jgi:DNA repair exonuclease SbcCD ATPase subunit
MRLKRLSLSGFRGAPLEVTLELAGKSCFIYAENGFGKTTLVDALEYWSTGDVEAYHREGALLDSLINLDSEFATVTCERVNQIEISRILRKRGGGRSTEAPPDPALNTVTPIPILRHKTMADFMAKSAGEKKDILLKILGLEELTKFRETLTTASNDAKVVANASQTALQSEMTALEPMCTEGSLTMTAEVLRVRVGLSQPITRLKCSVSLPLLSLAPRTSMS